MTVYRAFGLNLMSEFHIPQLPPVREVRFPEVTLRRTSLPHWEELPEEKTQVLPEKICFQVPGAGRFRVTGGTLIEADPDPDCSDGRLSVYLMGSCMGAILHQRRLLPLHGSCVALGERAVLITGDSGAGKSTLAAEFLAQGWKLMTDDVAVLLNPAQRPQVQSSYPSQKLWQDTMERYRPSPGRIHSLYTKEAREKFGVNVGENFREGTCPLRLVVRLAVGDLPTQIQPIEGFAKVDQLMGSTYRPYLIPLEERPRHFQSCVDLAGQVSMALVVRREGEQSAGRLYQLIANFLEEQCHE